MSNPTTVTPITEDPAVKIERALAILMRLRKSKAPTDVKRAIELAQEINEMAPIILAQTIQHRDAVLKELGLSAAA